MISNRAGIFIEQPSGYTSFKPHKLPPSPGITFDNEMIEFLSTADRKLGRLDGITQTLPNPSLFVAMYVQKEAILSSQIEGTQASLTDVLALNSTNENRKDVEEIVRYVKAMNYGLERLEEFPLSLRLIREIHSELLSGVRGSERSPGEFRTTQNWIGPAGCTLTTATFVPPSVPDMKEAIGDLEIYMHENDNLPPLIKIALIHAQFETIHPFLDGNGRMGRLLITFWLCQQKILSQPLLYLSYYFKQNRIEYYDRLMEVRKTGDWEQWIKYFLKGVSSISEEATNTALEILSLKTACENQIAGMDNINYNRLLEHLFHTPTITKNDAANYLQVAPFTASKIIDVFCDKGILTDLTPEKQRYKRYAFMKYIEILDRGTEVN